MAIHTCYSRTLWGFQGLLLCSHAGHLSVMSAQLLGALGCMCMQAAGEAAGPLLDGCHQKRRVS